MLSSRLKKITQNNEIIRYLYQLDSDEDRVKIWIGWFHSNFSIKKDHLNLLEKSKLLKAHKKRRLEHIASRELINIVLIQQNFSVFEVPRGIYGSPIWPTNYSGSISHKNNYVATMIIDQNSFVGIDIELIFNDFNTKLIMNRILTNSEKIIILDYTNYTQNILTTLIFSAKETLFKAFNKLDFNNIKLDTFRITRIDKNHKLIFIEDSDIPALKFTKEFTVNFHIMDNYIITWIVS